MSQINSFQDFVAFKFSIYPEFKNELSALYTRIVSIYETLDDRFKSSYAKEISTIVSKFSIEKPLSVEYYKAIEAINIEREKQLALLKAGAILDTSAVKIKNSMTYLRYDKKLKTRMLLTKKPDIQEGILIQNDVPILLAKNDKYLPYIYETKYYATTKYGIRGKDLNQLIKYQAAFEHGLIAGATIDIEGRISTSFIDWLDKNKEHIKDINIVSTFRLPSGKCYTFNLKGNTSEILNLRNNKDYTSELDKALVHKLETISIEDYIKVCTHNIESSDLSDMHPGCRLMELGRTGKRILDNPEDIDDLHTYFYFSEKVQSVLNKKVELYESSTYCTPTF